MPVAEYHCLTCRAEYEYHFSIDQWPYPEAFQCVTCGGAATRYFSTPPGMSPDPHWTGYWDQQLGKYISSRDEKRRILKAKGLEEVSPQEHDRALENYKEKEDVIPENDPKFREAMEKAYADTVAGNIPPATPRKINLDDTLVVS